MKQKTLKEIYFIMMGIIILLAVVLPMAMQANVIIVVDPYTGTAKPVVVISK